MSIAGILEAMQSDYLPAIRLVWQCLENHAGPASRCYRMTNEQIAAELHLGLNTVVRAIAELEEDKIIRVERFKRRVSTFHMLRVYPEKGSKGQPRYSNGHAPEDALEVELTTQNGGSSGDAHADLTTQTGCSTVELTTQTGCSSAELTTQNGWSESTSKNPPEKTPPTHRATAATEAGEVSVCVGNFDFEIFWNRYPKKVKRGRARAAWEVAITKAPASTIVAAVQQFVWPQETRWIPDPHNWLAAEQWDDEVSSYDDDILRAAGLDPRDYRGGPTIDGDAVRSPVGVLQ